MENTTYDLPTTYKNIFMGTISWVLIWDAKKAFSQVHFASRLSISISVLTLHLIPHWDSISMYRQNQWALYPDYFCFFILIRKKKVIFTWIHFFWLQLMHISWNKPSFRMLPQPLSNLIPNSRPNTSHLELYTAPHFLPFVILCQCFMSPLLYNSDFCKSQKHQEMICRVFIGTYHLH